MKQNFLYSVLLVLVFASNPVNAQTVEVKSLSDFSTVNPPKTISVQLLEPVEIKKNKFVKAGGTLEGDLVDVVSPKRLKRDANFAFVPKSYTDIDGKTRKIKVKIKASYTEPIDKKQVAKKTVATAGNLVVAGFSLGVAAVEGAVKNEDGNRFKSSVSSAYEASPLAYAKKGEELEVKSGQVFFLKFPSPSKIDKTVNEQNEQKENENSTIKGQNYSITIEKE